jgi:hypothetical protein
MRDLSVLTREYVEIEISATDPTGAPVDPAALPVEIAMTPPGDQPDDSDWLTATHLRGAVFGVLAGAGTAVTPPRGEYVVRYRITDDPERPVGVAGKIRFY